MVARWWRGSGGGGGVGAWEWPKEIAEEAKFISLDLPKFFAVNKRATKEGVINQKKAESQILRTSSTARRQAQPPERRERKRWEVG